MDETGRLAGRGAYLCADGSCWRQALDKGTLQRALEVPLPEELKQLLRTRDTAATHTMNHEMNEGEAIGQE
jgi:predicted RNA-binding protein YlxR (DUF448 family)